jgi:hypothetical protein
MRTRVEISRRRPAAIGVQISSHCVRSRKEREASLRCLRAPCQPAVRWRTSRDTAGNMLVQVNPDRHPSGCFAMIPTLRIDLRKVIPARFVNKGALLAHLCLDFLDVIEIPGERGVYVGERD